MSHDARCCEDDKVVKAAEAQAISQSFSAFEKVLERRRRRRRSKKAS